MRTGMLFCAFCICSALMVRASSINKSGHVDVSQTWDADTILVVGEVTIDDACRLTIAPGTYVEFQSSYAINVQGQILAVGTATDSIIFTARDTAEGWKGIRFDETPTTNDSSRISYCRLEYGRATGTNPANRGGALFVRSFSALTVSHCTIRKNAASGLESYGSGMYCSDASPVVINTTFSENAGGWRGGGMYCGEEASPTLIDVTFYNNRSDAGGGMYCNGSSPTLTNVRFISCRAVKGSGIYCNSASPTVINALFQENGQIVGTNSGGAVYCENGAAPVLSDITFRENRSAWGGGMYVVSSSPRIVNSIFENNGANDGGGLFCNGSSPTIINCAFLYNHASMGGAVFCRSLSSPSFINGTLCGNSADSGGGVYSLSFSSPSFTNSILWGNSSRAGLDEVTIADTTATANFAWCILRGSNDSLRGPGAQANYDGDFRNTIATDPQFTDTAEGDYTLGAGSPCINAGKDDTTGLSLPFLDLAGRERIRGGVVDIGAYEYQAGSSSSLPRTVTSITRNTLTAYPNPFSGHTVVTFPTIGVANAAKSIRLTIYTAEGRRVRKLFNGKPRAGTLSVTWNGNNDFGNPVQDGIYVCVLSAGDSILKTKRLTLKR
ncbi:MAG: T9SS type A sorting domain-containing protein [Chitinivibrionales bacterium]|nr:T9SS type A sorting domain-containing protein [Chitinivibrionales bacterium]MBD3356856.1 T9SS type A sorting domain-containing protein [Chitinivibrionales bacterium]